MKAKLIFFIIITLLLAIKKGYVYICEVRSLVSTTNGMQINNSVFDSLEAFALYKKQVIQIIDKNKLKISKLNLLITKENKIVLEKLEKQIEIIVFKNNELNKNISNYSLQSVSKFQFYKTNFNMLLAENNQLIVDILEKHQTIIKTK